jgi:hypothetical protein
MKQKILLWLVLLLLLAGCAGNPPAQEQLPTGTTAPAVTATSTVTNTPEPTATTTPTPSPSPTLTLVNIEVGPTGFPADVNPLTGSAVADSEVLDRRPIATKLQLYPRTGRPLFGINSADLVWEYYHNGGITRLHAIYYGQDAVEVGPIRSARMPDHDLILMYQSLFAYGSADWRINQRLFNAPYAPYLVLEGVSNECPPTAEKPLCRYEPNGQNLLLSGTAELSAYISAKNLPNDRQNLDGMYFVSDVPSGGEPGSVLNVRYSLDAYNRWEYDPQTGRYIRYQDTRLDDGTGEEYDVLVERFTEEPVSAANVILVIANHSYFYRSGSSEIVEINLSGTGKAFVFRDGSVYEVNWSRLTQDSILQLLNPDGSVFALKPGNTWFQVVGESSIQTQPEDDVYRFEFRIP